MKKEIDSIHTHNIFEIIEHSNLKTPVLEGCWVYRLKTDEDREIIDFKTHWIVQGFCQCKEINYNEIYISVVTVNTIQSFSQSLQARNDKYIKSILLLHS